uniref:Uncharacterized protein n=1 Tax=Arundo donax TaxID=35708 RepID=A0A0A9FS65_ARUDO
MMLLIDQRNLSNRSMLRSKQPVCNRIINNCQWQLT